MGIHSSKPDRTNPSTFATQVDSASSSPTTHEEALKEYKSYDYVIVGAGATGCVLASRLSENPNVSVLLVEAGSHHADSPFSHIPAAYARQFRTPFDWIYHTTPQPGLNNRKLFHPRGKMLGGCTSLNAMMYHHCAPTDFDEWEKLGAKGWGYKDLAPFFRSSEKFTPNPRYPGLNPKEHGDSGPLQTGFSYLSKINKTALVAMNEIGIPYNPDINTPRGTLGATNIVTFIDPKGRRSSTATAYLSADVVARKNLTIVVKTLATRVLFSSDGVPRAIGIEVAQDESSPRFRVSARQEVILSAGTYNTPQMLNLSGVGAKSELEKFEIKVVKDLPAVGKNLCDHVTGGTLTVRTKKGYSLMYLIDPILSLPSLVCYLVTGKGPLSSNVAEIAAFVRTDDPKIKFDNKLSTPTTIEDSTSGPGAPDIELMAAAFAFIDHGAVNPGPNCYAIGPTLLRPLSVGTVSISSANPFDKAVVDPNYLSNPNDLKKLVRGVRLCMNIVHAKAFREVVNLKANPTDKNDYFWSGDVDPDTITDEEVAEYLKTVAETMYHPVGTARIGGDEKDSVVNTDLKVHGIQGLRVIDASIFPSQLSGHPTAPLVAIAEKASIMIAKEYSSKPGSETH